MIFSQKMMNPLNSKKNKLDEDYLIKYINNIINYSDLKVENIDQFDKDTKLHHKTKLKWKCFCNEPIEKMIGDVIVKGKWCEKCCSNDFGFIPNKILILLCELLLNNNLLKNVENNYKFSKNNFNIVYYFNTDKNDHKLYKLNKDKTIMIDYRNFNKGISYAKVNLYNILKELIFNIHLREGFFDESSQLSKKIYKIIWNVDNLVKNNIDINHIKNNNRKINLSKKTEEFINYKPNNLFKNEHKIIEPLDFLDRLEVITQNKNDSSLSNKINTSVLNNIEIYSINELENNNYEQK